MKTKLLYAAAAILLAGCNSVPADPRTEHNQAPTLAEIYADRLADNTPRIESADFTIAYGTPGVLHTVAADSTNRLINIDNGLQADFHPSDSLLHVNGLPVSVARRHVLKKSGRTVWYALCSSDTIIVVAELP